MSHRYRTLKYSFRYCANRLFPWRQTCWKFEKSMDCEQQRWENLIFISKNKSEKLSFLMLTLLLKQVCACRKSMPNKRQCPSLWLRAVTRWWRLIYKYSVHMVLSSFIMSLLVLPLSNNVYNTSMSNFCIMYLVQGARRLFSIKYQINDHRSNDGSTASLFTWTI